MQTTITPEQRQAARREIVQQVKQGATASVARGCKRSPHASNDGLSATQASAERRRVR